MQSPVLVTGGEGFVGTWLLVELAQAGVPALAAERNPKQPGRLALDVTDPVAVDRVIAAHRPKAVVHLAATSFVPDAELAPRSAYEVNLFGSLNIASAILRHAPSCQLLFVSSSEIYGGSFRSGKPLGEGALLDPLNVYASTKAAADLAIGQLATRGLQAVRFRPFNHCGPGQAARFVIASFAQQIAAAELGRQPPVIKTGNLDAVRDFVDVRDIVRAYVAAIVRSEPLAAGTILNLASGVPRRIGDILEQMTIMSRITMRAEQQADLTRRMDIPFAIGDACSARELLGWAPETAFNNTLAAVLENARVAASAPEGQ